jgi:hypothetical protein
LAKCPPAGDDDNHADIRQSLHAEIDEILKYKWYLGEKLGYDPLNDRSLNDICHEWIEKYAADFRQWWEKNNPQRSIPKALTTDPEGLPEQL